MIQEAASPEANGRPRALALQIGLGSGIIAGCIDLTLMMLPGPESLARPLAVLPPLAATMVVFVTGYIALSTVSMPVRRLTKLHAGAWHGALGITLLFFACGVFFNKDFRPRFDLSSAARAGLIVLGLAIICTVTYAGLKSIDRTTRSGRAWFAIALATPAVFVEAAAFTWYQKFQLEGIASLRSALSVLVLLIATGGSLGMSFRVRSAGLRSVANPALAVLIFLSASLVLAWPEADLEPPPSASGKGHKISNVILISIDTLRADALSWINPESALTPNLEELGRQSVVFNRAISPAPWTLPALSAIMTGLLPTVTGVMAMNSQLAGGFRTLAEQFRAAGYITGGTGYNGFLAPHYQLTQGFQEFASYPDASMATGFGVSVLKRYFPKKYRFEATSEELADSALEWFEKYRDQEFFYWIHFYDPHAPYAPPEKYLPDVEIPPRIGPVTRAGEGPLQLLSLPGGKRGEFSLKEREWIRHLYDAEVRYVDDQIGRIINKLRELDLYDDSLIVFFSDHGEEFWDHGGLAHGHTLYHELLWVPLMFKLPRSTTKSAVETRVSTVSIAPTILELAGFEYDPDVMSGRSLTPLFFRGMRRGDWPAIFSMALHRELENKEAVYFDDMKYIRTVQTYRDELFDRALDPMEQINIDRDWPEKTELGSDLLDARAASDAALAERMGIETGKSGAMDEGTIRQLRDLGYL